MSVVVAYRAPKDYEPGDDGAACAGPPHLYFQAPGGQVFRLVGINEDLSRYERGPDPGSGRVVVRSAEPLSE
jgi:hypothetical protein